MVRPSEKSVLYVYHILTMPSAVPFFVRCALAASAGRVMLTYSVSLDGLGAEGNRQSEGMQQPAHGGSHHTLDDQSRLT